MMNRVHQLTFGLDQKNQKEDKPFAWISSRGNEDDPQHRALSDCVQSEATDHGPAGP